MPFANRVGTLRWRSGTMARKAHKTRRKTRLKADAPEVRQPRGLGIGLALFLLALRAALAVLAGYPRRQLAI